MLSMKNYVGCKLVDLINYDKMSLTQEQIANELGVDVRTIQRLKKLQTLSPDLQQLIEEIGIQ